ncbi:protein terminal ear1 homolog [Corylus avellana]|uniref:protein terminal ear1 homolog n=1 Tax=Corylus avellana TaxID=13451 RepID=UPI00286C1A75|nr:protein terminal ear1 homolog [Corylus avellana]
MSKPLNPNAQSFHPEKEALAITFAFSRRQPQQLLLPLLPLSQAWPPVPAFLPDGPCGPYGQVIYDAGAQPEPIQKLKGPEVFERVDRGPRCQVQRPRLLNRKASSVNCRGKVWIPKKEGKSCVSNGVLPFPPVLEVMNNNFHRGNSSKTMNAAPARIIHFPSTLDEVISSDKTTVMIKNIPNQFIRDDLLAILDKHCREENMKPESQSCKSAYDLVYLPMDFRKFWYQGKMTNLGYAFVNFTSCRAAFRFFLSFHKHVWAVTENKKICEVTLAELQGKEPLIDSFKNRLFWCQTSSFLPAVFETPRDGSNLSTFTTVGIRVPRSPPKRQLTRAFRFPKT